MKALKTQIRNKLKQEMLSSKEILALLQEEDTKKQFEHEIQEYIQYLAIGIVNAVRICSAKMVVIGGSFVHYQGVLFTLLKKELDKITPSHEGKKVEIKLTKLGNDAGMIGASRIV
ncbi:MAG: ROK family protein [Clostridia bacterium]|nr:ROK family protein [Clostridia bacterium]